MSEKMTEKQSDFIEIMVDVIGISFNGSTKEDARKYISDNMEEFDKYENVTKWGATYG